MLMLGCNRGVRNGNSASLRSGLCAVRGHRDIDTGMSLGKAGSCLGQEHDGILMAKSVEVAEQLLQTAAS